MIYEKIFLIAFLVIDLAAMVGILLVVYQILKHFDE